MLSNLLSFNPSITDFCMCFLCKDEDETLQGKGRKRAAPRGRGRGRGKASTSKRGRTTDNSSSSFHRLLSSRDDEDDDDDDMGKKLNKSQPRVMMQFWINQFPLLYAVNPLVALKLIVVSVMAA